MALVVRQTGPAPARMPDPFSHTRRRRRATGHCLSISPRPLVIAAVLFAVWTVSLAGGDVPKLSGPATTGSVPSAAAAGTKTGTASTPESLPSGVPSGVPVGPLTSASLPPPTAGDTQPPRPNSFNTFPLMSVAAPSNGGVGGGNGNVGLAWVEIEARASDGEDPSQEMLIDLHARLGGTQVTIPRMAVSLGEEEFITWLGPTRVLLLGSFLVDLEAPGEGAVKSLDVPPWGVRVSPDGSKVAYWGYADPTGGAKGPAVYDLATGKTMALQLFRFEDWGLPTYDMGIAPLVTWLDDRTVLFDGPYQKLPATYVCDLSTGKVGVWREKAWSVRASGDGRYVAFIRREAWLVPRPGAAYSLSITEIQSGATAELRVEAPLLGAALVWDRATAGRFALMDGGRVAVGTVGGGKAAVLTEMRAMGMPVGVRCTAGGVSFFDLERVNFAPTKITAKILPWPPKP